MADDAVIVYTLWVGTADGHGGTDYEDHLYSFDDLGYALEKARQALSAGRCVLVEPETVARAEWEAWQREAACQT